MTNFKLFVRKRKRNKMWWISIGDFPLRKLIWQPFYQSLSLKIITAFSDIFKHCKIIPLKMSAYRINCLTVFAQMQSKSKFINVRKRITTMDQRHHLFCVILKARITSIKWIETSFETISIFGRLQNEEKFMEKKEALQNLYTVHHNLSNFKKRIIRSGQSWIFISINKIYWNDSHSKNLSLLFFVRFFQNESPLSFILMLTQLMMILLMRLILLR